MKFSRYIKIFFLLLLMWSSVSSFSQQKKKKIRAKKYYQYHAKVDTNIFSCKVCFEPTDSTKNDSLVSMAKAYIGVPYRYGGADPRGFDCSGFVMYCYKRYGVFLSHYAGSQMIGETITEKNAKPGDIIFFGYKSRKKKNYYTYISHSGIVYKNDNGKVYFIHSESHRGIRVDCLDQQWYRTRFMGIRRVN